MIACAADHNNACMLAKSRRQPTIPVGRPSNQLRGFGTDITWKTPCREAAVSREIESPRAHGPSRAAGEVRLHAAPATPRGAAAPPRAAVDAALEAWMCTDGRRRRRQQRELRSQGGGDAARPATRASPLPRLFQPLPAALLFDAMSPARRGRRGPRRGGQARRAPRTPRAPRGRQRLVVHEPDARAPCATARPRWAIPRPRPGSA